MVHLEEVYVPRVNWGRQEKLEWKAGPHLC